MDVIQTISDFKQNLQVHPAAKAGAAATSPGKVTGLAQTSAATGGVSSTAGSTTITANDFLQLLVAEMKNQDPTANQDPNAYIDQLVQVNSLQQLISINQDLTPISSATSAVPTGGAAQGPLGQAALGSADGTPSATLARSMSPPVAWPHGASVSGATALSKAGGSSGTPLGPPPIPGTARNAPAAASVADKESALRL